MTVILALKGNDHAVLASDTLEMRGPSEGMYRQTAHKIQRVNGTWAVGVSGSLDGLQVVRDFGEERIGGLSGTMAVEDLANRMLDAYKKKGFSDETWFLLVGIKENGRPFIWVWRFTSEDGEVRIEGPREQDSGAIGACNHGALYFVKEFQRETMSVEQNVLLAFHCVAEVAKHDVRVARPVDIAVVRQNGVTRYAESQLSEFVQRSGKITATISEWLSSSDLRLPRTDFFYLGSSSSRAASRAPTCQKSRRGRKQNRMRRAPRATFPLEIIRTLPSTRRLALSAAQ